jgi:putative transposase
MNVDQVLFGAPRKRVRHYDLPGDAHFLTFSCFRRMPLLSKDRTRKWLVKSIAEARDRCNFDLWAWVIMPEHVHLLVCPRNSVYTISKILTAIKRPVAERAIAYLVSRKSRFLERLSVETKSRTYRRFWQAGPGQDHNIYDAATTHRVIDYIHNNPVRRGLVAAADNWHWSSARDWNGGEDFPLRVDRTVPRVVEIGGRLIEG